VSGAKGWADEAIAEVLISMLIMLAHLETDNRKTADQMQI
jgi:hypothetical protein